MRDLSRVPFLDRNVRYAISNTPIYGWAWQTNIKRNVIVMRCERFEICTDLVAHITVCGNAVRSRYHQINLAMLHQVTTSIVHDDSMRNAVLI